MRDALARLTRALIAIVLMTISAVLMPQVRAAASANAAPASSCAAVDELKHYIPLYALNVPKAGYWPGGKNVPYTVNRSLTMNGQLGTPYLERVAYCLDTETVGGRHEWAYASFDAFTNDPSLLGVPHTTIARRVTGLTTWGSNVTHVERADSGYLEFWPGHYRPATAPLEPTGDGSKFDFSDTPVRDSSGYGSMQVHNTANKETVLALNGWSNSRGRYLDIGTGNQRTGQPDWTFSQSGRTLASARLTVYVKPATSHATTCEQTVGELADYRLLYDVEVPKTAEAWAKGVTYATDNSVSLRATRVSRVAYCLDGMYGTVPAWGYASMNAWTQNLKALGVPMSGIIQRRVTGLTVRGSDVRPSDNSTGYLEIWPNRYSAALPPHAPPGSSARTWDIADTPLPASGPIPGTGGYGSFQVHDLTHHQTVLAVNGWAGVPRAPVSAGIGSARRGQPDWTFAANAGNWITPHLKVYVKPAGVDITTGPTHAQLYPRDHNTNTGTVVARGRVTDPAVTAVEMRIYREGSLVATRQASAAGQWELKAPIAAERASYTVEVWAQRLTGKTLIRRATDVVAGDAYVIEGQSNAVAAGGAVFFGPASSADLLPWVRTFGFSTADPAQSGYDRSWYRATGEGAEDGTSERGAIGQLGVRLGRDLADHTGIPIAILNGAHGGQPSTFFQRNDNSPTDLATNYGRLLRRVQTAGLADAVRGVIWYQGESDERLPGSPTAAQHDANVRKLLADWRADFAHLEHVYVVQIRSHCGVKGTAAVQEVQRRLAAVPGTSVMTTMGLERHDGCHYGYQQGYRRLADWLSLGLLRDLYRVVPATPADPPNPLRASWADTAHTSIRIDLTDATQALRCDQGSRADFILSGTAAKVAAVTCGTGYFNLALSRPGTGLTAITYTGHPGTATMQAMPTTPWIVNASGMGLLAFYQLPIS
ncbi:sialate O-acetylesterase [Streptomyces sp. L2]|uniref:sialate O-acetylesterase n=1 Tax=Streptomyces sp. L2 TaxID=2162665 RepID=UPI0013E959E8|nr:sialate O-acetylesterase [Streptomyces sp. L2]